MKYIATGLNRQEITWTAPYQDFLTKTWLSAATLNLYDEDSGILLGVAATDVIVDELLQFGTIEEITATLTKWKLNCVHINVTEC